MKVYIGKYLNFWGPYQIVESIFFWQEKYPNDKLAARWDYRLSDKLGKWLASIDCVSNLCNWIYEKRKRTEYVKIDSYDVWSMDSTLSLIVVPMLKQLKKVKHGAPDVDLEDVPKHLHPTKAEQKKYQQDGSTDKNFFKRFDWILDEMIWAHEQLLKEDGEDQFIIEHGEIDWTEYPEDVGKKTTPLRWKKKYKIDEKGRKAYHERIDNGLRLFGKYYRSLWD